MRDISEEWREILIFNELDTPQKIWNLKVDWFEEPNYARGGWSGVSRIELKLPNGGKIGAFLKRQEDHNYRSPLHPIKGRPTFVREFESIVSFEKHHIPSLEFILFEYWKAGGHQRAVLITKELDGYIPLSSTEYLPGGVFASTRKQKQEIFLKLADLMRVMHRNNFQHNSFYLKHVFAKQLGNDEVDLRLIDLEKVKKTLLNRTASFRDLYTLQRHADKWSLRDQLRFYQCYQNEKKLSGNSKKLWRDIANKVKRKASH